MDTAEILKKVRKLEIKTKGLSKHIFSGEYHSAFKGRGMSFSEVRNYSYGDDVRNIDWNVTARTGSPHIKIFEEERELTLMLLVDISASSFFGTHNQFKNELITELSALLAFSALSNNDKVGALLFADKIEKFISPKKGKKHVLRIIRELIDVQVQGGGTDLKSALEYITNLQKKRSIIFIISDFIDDNYENALKILSKRHDVVGVHVYDAFEENLPSIGLLDVYDPETGDIRLIDSSDKQTQIRHNQQFDAKRTYFKTTFTKAKADQLELEMSDDYIKTLMQFFKRRGR